MCKLGIAITLALALFVCCTQARSALKDGKQVPCEPEGRHYSPWELMNKTYMENDEVVERCLRFQCLNGTIKVFKQFLSKACDRPRTPEEWQLWVEQGPQRGEKVTMPPALVTTTTTTAAAAATQGDQQTRTSLPAETTQSNYNRPTRVNTSSPFPSSKRSIPATSATTTTTPAPASETEEATEESTAQYEDEGDLPSAEEGEEEESSTSSKEELEKYLEEAINDGKTTSDNELGPKKFKGKDLNPLPKWRSKLDAPDDTDDEEFSDAKGQQVPHQSSTTSTRRPSSRLSEGSSTHFGRPSSTRRSSKAYTNTTPEPEEVEKENQGEDEQEHEHEEEVATTIIPLPDGKRPVVFRKLNKAEDEHEMTKKIHTTGTITPIISNHLDYQPSVAASTQQEEPSPVFLQSESTWDRAFHVFLLFFYVCCLVVILGAVIIILKTLLGAFDIVVKTKAAKQAATLPSAPASRQMRTMFDLDV